MPRIYFLRVCLLALAFFGFTSPSFPQSKEIFQGREVASGELLVRFRGANDLQNQFLAAQDGDIVSAETIGRSGTMRLRSRNRGVSALMQAYSGRPDVIYAEPNYIWHRSDLPNDTFFAQQWALRNTGQRIGGQTGVSESDVDASPAWDISEGSRQFVVGIIDSGIDYTHLDLAENIWSAPTAFTVTISGQTITCPAGSHGFDAIARTCDPRDEDGHGTHVAGIIGAAGNNGTGVSGINRVASMMSLKFLGPDGGSTVDAVAAIEFAVQAKAIFGPGADVRILNNSWGGSNNSFVLLDAIRLAESHNMLFVAAAGNTSPGNNNDLFPFYPASYKISNLISVAATDNRDALASFSHWGFGSVDLGAPGVEILSTLPSGLYGYDSGTSMATPMVSGAAALVLSACPLTAQQLRLHILTSADSLPALAGKTATGGRLNIVRALTSCGGVSTPGFKLAASPGTQRMELNGSINTSITVVPVQGFKDPVELSVKSLPTGMTATFTPPFVAGASGTSTLTLNATPSLDAGTYLIEIVGKSGQTVRTSGISVTVGSAIGPGQTVSGTLSSTDAASSERVGKYADFYRLTLTSATQVTIDLKSALFDTFLYLLSNSGSILSSDDESGGSGNSKIIMTLAAGSYTIEVTSFEDGDIGSYSLSVNSPTLTTIAPVMGIPGTTVTVSLSGTRFSLPMTLDAGSGIAVTNVNTLSANTASATLVISDDSSPLPGNISVTTPEGTSNRLSFAVPPPIVIGQKIEGALTGLDQTAPHRPYRFADLYRLTVPANGSVTIDLTSTDIDAYLFLVSASGAVLFSNDDLGDTANSQIVAAPGPGTYFIEVTSFGVREIGAYTLSVNRPVFQSIAPGFQAQGSVFDVAITGSRLSAPMTVAAGSDIVVSNITVKSSTSATATFSIAPDAAVGPRDITLTTPEGTTNAMPFRVTAPMPEIRPGQTLVGTLSNTDDISPEFDGAFADFYRLTISSGMSLTITLQSGSFDAYLYLMDASGSPLDMNDDSDGNQNARITATLAPGTYFIEATSLESRETGDYTLSVSSLALLKLAPTMGDQRGTVDVVFSGYGFTAPMLVNAGPGIVVTNITVLSSTSASATLSIADSSPLGLRYLTLTTAYGVTNGIPFHVLSPIPSIPLNQNVSGSLSPSDQAGLNRPASYADFYRLILTSQTSLTIDLQSASFDTYLYLFSDDGEVLSTNNQGGGSNNARIKTTLGPGAYFVEATSFSPTIGSYTLSVTTSLP